MTLSPHGNHLIAPSDHDSITHHRDPPYSPLQLTKRPLHAHISNGLFTALTVSLDSCAEKNSNTEARLGAIDISQDNSQDVREDTAELASWALSDKASLSSEYSSPRPLLSPKAASTHSDNHERVNIKDLLDQPQTQASPRPDAIPEVSEPASPGSMHSSRKSPGMSALSDMLKQTPPTEDESPGMDNEDQAVYDLGVKPVMVQEAILSQPTERTALLLKQQVYGSLNDLESQKQIHNAGADQPARGSYATIRRHWRSVTSIVLHPKSWDSKVVWKQIMLKPASCVPSVILGLLLNILDALSYGESDTLLANCLLTIGRYDLIPAWAADLREPWRGRHLHVLCQLHSVSTRIFSRRQYIQRGYRI